MDLIFVAILALVDVVFVGATFIIIDLRGK